MLHARTCALPPCLGSATLVVFAMLSLGLEDAVACSCLGIPFAQKYEQADNVFTAIVTAEETEFAGGITEVRSSFATTQVFKGRQPFANLVTYRSSVAGCGIGLEVGRQYLFFVPDSGQVGGCYGTKETEVAGPELAALESFVSGERSELVEPWHFGSYDEGCTVSTLFDVGEGQPQGALVLDGLRPDRNWPGFGRARITVMLLTDRSHGELTLILDEEIYEPTVYVRTSPPGIFDGDPDALVSQDYVVSGEQAEEILRRTMRADTLRLRLDKGRRQFDVDINVSTANLADAGTGEMMLECIDVR
jgi:hypothetical protein